MTKLSFVHWLKGRMREEIWSHPLKTIAWEKSRFAQKRGTKRTSKPQMKAQLTPTTHQRQLTPTNTNDNWRQQHTNNNWRQQPPTTTDANNHHRQLTPTTTNNNWRQQPQPQREGYPYHVSAHHTSLQEVAHTGQVAGRLALGPRTRGRVYK